MTFCFFYMTQGIPYRPGLWTFAAQGLPDSDEQGLFLGGFYDMFMKLEYLYFMCHVYLIILLIVGR